MPVNPHKKEFIEIGNEKFKAYIVENTWMTPPTEISRLLSRLIEHGWGNGYVALPQDHPWVLWIMEDGKKEDKHKYSNSAYDLYKIGVEVHGGVTFGIRANEAIDEGDTDGEKLKGLYIIRFDTAHYQDNMDRWPKERVMAETNDLLKQAIDTYKPGEIAVVISEYVDETD